MAAADAGAPRSGTDCGGEHPVVHLYRTAHVARPKEFTVPSPPSRTPMSCCFSCLLGALGITEDALRRWLAAAP
jgi:hypothetical protein